MLATLSLVVRYMPLQEGGRPYIRKKTPQSGGWLWGKGKECFLWTYY